MDKQQTRVRPGFILALLVIPVIPVLAGFFLPVYIGGKPTPGDRAAQECRNYLAFTKFASSGGKYIFDSSKLSAFEATHGWFTGKVFDTNQKFFAKTNFYLNSGIEGPVIFCSQKFFYPKSKKSFGCSFGSPSAIYAVGYADGTSKLIPEAEFTNLNTAGFVLLSSLATNSVLKISK